MTTGGHILVAAPIFPWPADTGARMRVAHLLQALATVAPVDLVVMAGSNQVTPCVVPPDAPVARVKVVARPAGRSVGMARVGWAVAGTLPVEMASLDFGPLRSEVSGWLEGPYRAAWIFMPELFVALRPLVRGPLFVDLFDLEDRKVLRRLDVPPARPSATQRARWVAADCQGRRNARLWQRLHRRIGREAAQVTVCSPTDHRHLGLPSAVVVANGYERVGDPLGRVETGRPPTIVFQGSMIYAPNADGARVLAREIAPAVRREVPEAVVRVVGRHHDPVALLHDPPGVVVTGHVPDLSVELAGADLVAVPLRFGSGTRIKILEAFAHRIPVVSTPVGAEGIDAVDGVHLLVRAPGADFATACVRVLEDPALRRRMVDSAEELWSERYRWSAIRDQVATLVRAVVQ